MNPSYAPGHIWYGWYHAQGGHFEEGLAELGVAKELDPISVSTDFYIGEMLYFARRYDQAIDRLQESLEIDPSYPPTLWFMALARQQTGQHKEMISDMERASELSGDDPGMIAFLAYTYGIAGRRSEAQEMLDELQAPREQGYASPFDVALVYAGLGEPDRAFEWLEKACEERVGFMVYLKTFPVFDSLRSDPRLASLIRRVGLEP